jgi:hypothetical protein
MIELYDFVKNVKYKKKKNPKTLNTFLEEKGFVKIESSSFKLMRLDLYDAEKSNSIKFKIDGVYLTKNGIEYKGYMYLKKYWINFDSKVKFPSFHITRCSVVAEIDKRKDFVWHNSNEAEIQDRSSGIMYKKNLKLCRNCRIETMSKIITTQDFYDSLDKDENIKENVLIDLNGYVKGWLGNRGISNTYKKTKDYKCESCNIQMAGSDKRFIHTDHIDGNKQNNPKDYSNFQSLCILCHCYKDEYHRRNFGKIRMKRELYSFVFKYRSELVILQNKYLKLFDVDNKSPS